MRWASPKHSCDIAPVRRCSYRPGLVPARSGLDLAALRAVARGPSGAAPRRRDQPRTSHERPADARRRVVLAENLNSLGLLTAASEPDQAEAAYSEAATLLETAVHNKSNRRAITSLGSVLNNWGNLAAERGQTELAFARFERGLAPITEMLRREPADTTLRNRALSLHGAGRIS